MEDNEIDMEWVKSQLGNARVGVSVGIAVIELIRTFATLNFPTESLRDQALDLFTKLAKSEAIIEETEAVYAPALAGFNIMVGNEVRVRADAFSGLAGRAHNGRVGKVVAKRNGDVVVRITDDKFPKMESAHYPPSALELRVK